jgi:aspartyl-tRNA(Asn)/glutamyl-tRNA(Gln) amidotransferase subunit B
MDWEPIIGLEVHVQLSTQSKIFSGSATGYGADPNTQACVIDLGMPGVLPVLNKEVVNMAIKFGLAVDAEICEWSVFARKNYFYPDLPKGYQISQHNLPIVGLGHLDIILEDNSVKRIGVTRAHLEEDAGKSLHEDFHGMTGVDLNRAGMPLLEIVSEPDIRTPKEAVAYLKTLHSLVRYLDISDGNLQEGSFRCDVNVSVRPRGQKTFGTRSEVKNLNSFRFVEKSIEYEIARQIDILENDGEIFQETRLFDSDKNETRSLRAKEDAHDYRYFPEPDLLPVEITGDMIEAIRSNMPELPQQKMARFTKTYGLNAYDASFLISSRDVANYFEEVVMESKSKPKIVTNWIMGELSAALNKDGVEIINSPVNSKQLAALLKRIDDNTISGKIAKTVFDAMWDEEGGADEIIEKKGLKQVTDDSAIEKLVDEVIATYANEAAAYRNGKTKLFGFFVGQIMRLSKGKANPQQVNEILKKKLAES